VLAEEGVHLNDLFHVIVDPVLFGQLEFVLNCKQFIIIVYVFMRGVAEYFLEFDVTLLT